MRCQWTYPIDHSDVSDVFRVLVGFVQWKLVGSNGAFRRTDEQRSARMAERNRRRLYVVRYHRNLVSNLLNAGIEVVSQRYHEDKPVLQRSL